VADSRKIEKLVKVRRLARDNPSKEEGAAAEERLRELMKKHGVTEAQLDAFEGRPERPRPHPWRPHAHEPSFVVVINPGSPFGQVFGFGFGFNVTSSGGAGTSTDWTAGW
jgi:hypothetical protein